MWLFTRYGFFSLACGKKPDGSIDPQILMVRSRRASHLRSLAERFPALAGAEVVTLPDRDYRYRIIVTKETWAEVIGELAREQEWSNFKSETAQYQGAAGSDYEKALHKVWTIMYDFQHREPRK